MNDKNNKARNRRAEWTVSEIHYLETYFRTMRMDEIAEYLGRTESAVKSMALKLRLPVPKVLAWSEAENDILRRHYESVMPVTEIAAMLPGRALKSVLAKARNLGLSRVESGLNPAWTENEIRLMARYYPSEGQKVIRRLPGRTANSVRQKSRELGIRYTGDAQFRVWSEQDRQRLEEHQFEPFDEIRRLFPERNKNSLRTALGRLRKKQRGTSRPVVKTSASRADVKKTGPKSTVRRWSEAEKAVLTLYYESTMPMKDILAQLPGREKKSVFAMADAMELTRPRGWSDKELQILTRYYPSEGKGVIARLPGRSVSSVVQKACDLNIRHVGNAHFRPWSDEDIERLREHLHADVESLAALFPTRTPSSLRHAIRRVRKMQGDYHPATPAAPWSDAEKSVLVTHYETVMPMKQILAMLPGRAKNSVFAMAATLGLTRPVGWTEKELLILKQFYPSEGTAVIHLLSGRTINATRRMASKLNI